MNTTAVPASPILFVVVSPSSTGATLTEHYGRTFRKATNDGFRFLPWV
jgi:hypothetical protein